MTAQASAAAMDGQSCVAGLTLGNPAAIVTLQGGSVTAAVEEQQGLLPQAQGILNCRNEVTG